MENRKFGFAIVGTGSIAGIHAQAIAALDNGVLLGVFSKTEEKAKVFANQYSCKVYSSLEDLIQIDGLDIVCICTPSGAHMEPALKSIKAGKHCLIEKPLEVSLDKCDEIIDAAEENNVKVAVVYPTRFYPVSEELKKALNTDRFGNLVLGSAYVKWSRDEKYYNSAAWRGTWELDGGGALMNQAIHSVDMLQWYMGDVESVQAITGNLKHKNIEVEDTAVAILRFKNGALGTIECSTAVFPGAYKRLEIMGTKGSVVMEDNSLHEWQFESKIDDDDRIKESYSGNHLSKGGVANPMDISYYGHQKQMEDLIDAIVFDRKPLIDGIEGRKSVEIVRAIYDSAKTGKTITLPL